VRDADAKIVREHIDAVDTALEQARAKWSGVVVGLSSLWGGTDNRQVLGAIEVMRRAWDTQKRRGVELTGKAETAETQQELDRWVDFANDLLKNLADTAQESEANHLGRVAIHVAAASVADVRAAAVSVWSARRWIVTGLVAASVVIVVVLVVRK
jgi:hypothetical protein